MKRLELFEFEDFSWLPAIIRTGATNLIVVLHRLTGTADVIANLIRELREKHEFDQVTDLGSGSGGPMPEAIEQVNESSPDRPLELLLTDLHPNPNTVRKINDRDLPHVRYHEGSVDATNIGAAPGGLKTMIASFHHMDPAVAKKILHSAQENNEPILIYEIAKNNVPVLIWWLLLPVSLIILVLMTLIMTPFVRPLSLGQIVFTYLIPLIPLVYAWDGQASLMRTYTFSDIEELLGALETDSYQWKIGEAKKTNGRSSGYFIMGYPKN
ncbi:MAG: hypothetical protein R2824_02965 [Saprospiraceae bacterium]|nr:hypothetical protein [Lewinella sp.]